MLHEFDDDRRSCRRRLAGHNRRRRKNQPDATAALASILADQNALSKIMNPLGPLQGWVYAFLERFCVRSRLNSKDKS